MFRSGSAAGAAFGWLLCCEVSPPKMRKSWLGESVLLPTV